MNLNDFSGALCLAGGERRRCLEQSNDEQMTVSAQTFLDGSFRQGPQLDLTSPFMVKNMTIS
jgi:hypothetical protein